MKRKTQDSARTFKHAEAWVSKGSLYHIMISRSKEIERENSCIELMIKKEVSYEVAIYRSS